MPTYEYICKACDHEFEEFQSITAPPLKKCPACAKPKLQRKIGTGAGIIFKGSGFYETDYRSDSYKKAEKADKESGKPAEAKSDATPASKSDSGTKAGAEKSAGNAPSPTPPAASSSPAPAARPTAPASGKTKRGGKNSTSGT